MRIPPELLAHLRDNFALEWRGIHGAPHWARVARIGERVALEAGARLDVVRLFAVFHDSCRQDDGYDPTHGASAAKLAKRLHGELFDLDTEGLELLVEACTGHSEGRLSKDITIQACWDADRLDLGRVGIEPLPELLGSDAARALLPWANERADRAFEPAFVKADWRV